MKADLIGSLSRLQGMSARTDADERRILEQAEKMLDESAAALDEAQAQAKLGDANAEARYQQIVLDRGRLNIIIARAREALGG